MPFWRLFYHLVWTAKLRQPLLTPVVEPVVHGLLRSKATGLGATVFALDGTDDHVHMVVSVPPKIAIADFIGKAKASTSARFNQARISTRKFFWQNEYGAFSCDAIQLPSLIAYVNRQKEHHANGTTIPVLEATEPEPAQALREPSSSYEVETATWREQMLLGG